MKEVTVICAPLDQMPVSPVPGASVRQCRDCGAKVWLSPSGRNLAETVETVCPSCALKLKNVQHVIMPQSIKEAIRCLNQERQ